MSDYLRDYLSKYSSIIVGDFPVLRNVQRLMFTNKLEEHFSNVFAGLNPLHIGLNAQETVVNTYHPFFKRLNEAVFGSR